MAVKVQLRRDTAANWASEDPVLAHGEIGIDTDARKGKIGDGSTAWSSLDFGFAGPGVIHRGTYSGAAAYVAGEIVYNQDTSWISVQDTTGNAPPTLPTESNSYWQLMVAVPAGSGTVTSVAVSGSDGIEVDSGSPITTSGTIALGVNATGLRAHINVEDGADATDATNVGSSIHGASAKTTPVDADTMPLIDSAAANVLKKVTWANIKATLKTYFDSLTTTLTNKTIALGSNTVSGTAAQFDTACTDDNFLFDSDLGKQTVFVPASSMSAASTNGPASADIEATTNAQNYTVLDFDASTDEYAHFQIAMPKGWNEGTITFQVFWSTTATDTDGVAWGLQGVAVSDGDTVDASWGTAVVVTDDAQSAAGDVLVTAESSAVTIAGTPAAGDLCFFRLFRDVSDANDDMTEDARLVGVKLLYTIDALKDD